MTRTLDRADIQGNILSAYGKLGFPKGRSLVLTVSKADAGRAFVRAVSARVTTALLWSSARRPTPKGLTLQDRPKVAVNIAFTFSGLVALGVPTRTLSQLPAEFIDGMAARAAIVGDVGPNRPETWDAVWRYSSGALAERAHILITLNAQMQSDGTAVPELQAATDWVLGLCAASEGGVALRAGHGEANAPWQEMSAIMDRSDPSAPKPSPTEHFGFVDGLGDPVFEGQYPPEEEPAKVRGNGAYTPEATWRPLATGEFLLGYPDEAQEIAGAPVPNAFSRNGSYFAYRKLHQNVAAFEGALAEHAQVFQQVAGLADLDAAKATLRAKMVGRWDDGTPLMAAPTYAAWQARRGTAGRPNDIFDFTYVRDPEGVACPATSHIRRVNTRDSLDPLFPAKGSASTLNNRRRILRRGLPYGDPAASERGIIMMNYCASLGRQFEFVQQQWLNYGLDSNSGNDTCPLVGLHGAGAKFVIPSDPASGRPPYIMDRLPQFVETRGGDYFFAPSLTALRMIGDGVIDPT